MIERPYESTDLPGIVETCTASIHALAAAYYSPEQTAAWASVLADETGWQERLARLHTCVVESDGKLAGFAAYTDDGYLDFLYTHPVFARQGVATRLYARAESVWLALGVARVTTHASLAARPFLEHHGFRVEREECVECRGVSLRRFAMHKPLPNTRDA